MKNFKFIKRNFVNVAMDISTVSLRSKRCDNGNGYRIGRFTLSNVPPSGTLEVTYVEIHRQVIPINGRTAIDIVLQEDTQSF